MAEGVRIRHRKGCSRPQGCGCSWSWSVEVGGGPSGMRGPQATGTEPTQREALKARAQALLKLRAEQGLVRSTRRLTVGDFLQSWLAALLSESRIRSTTLESYRTAVRLYLVPLLGDIRLSELRPTDIDRAIVSVRTTRPDLSAATIRRHFAVLGSALADAYRQDLVVTNAYTRTRALPRAERTRVAVWELDEIGRFLAHPDVTQHPLGSLFHLAIMTGLRRGELVGLRWRSVDLERRFLEVTEQAVMVRGVVTYGPAKTQAGQGRRVDLDGGTADLLRRARVQQAADRLAWGEGWAGDDFVFAQSNGSPWRPDAVYKAFRRVSAAVGLPAVGSAQT